MGWQGWLVTSPERIKNNCTLFKSRSFFVLTFFRLTSDAKCETIPTKFESLHKYIWYVYCSFCWIVKVITSYLLAIQRVPCPLKAKASSIVWPLTKVSFWKDLITILLPGRIGSFCIHMSPFVLVPSRQMRRMEEVVLIYVLVFFVITIPLCNIHPTL